MVRPIIPPVMPTPRFTHSWEAAVQKQRMDRFWRAGESCDKEVSSKTSPRGVRPQYFQGNSVRRCEATLGSILTHLYRRKLSLALSPSLHSMGPSPAPVDAQDHLFLPLPSLPEAK